MDKSVTVRLWEKDFDPDVIRTRSLLIWSQTRYRCATESRYVRSYRDLNSDRWIQSPECKARRTHMDVAQMVERSLSM